MRFTQHAKTERGVRLDLKDKKILYWLSENARMPYTRIAKKVGLSKDAVKYRIKNLERDGVIQGYISIIETSKIGYYTYHVFLRLKQVDKEIRENLIRMFQSRPFVKVIIEFSGKYDFEIGVMAKRLEELDDYITKIIDDASDYLQGHIILAISKYYIRRVFPRSFLDLKEGIEVKDPSPSVKTDGTDREILRIISNKATTSMYEIGQEAGISADAANYRIRKLVKEGLIVRHVPVINYSALDYTVYGVFMNINNLDTKGMGRLEGFIKGNKNIIWAVKTIGSYNLLMYVCAKKSDDLHQTLIALRELFSSDIKDYETLIGYEEFKYTYFPEICLEEGKGA